MIKCDLVCESFVFVFGFELISGLIKSIILV